MRQRAKYSSVTGIRSVKDTMADFNGGKSKGISGLSSITDLPGNWVGRCLQVIGSPNAWGSMDGRHAIHGRRSDFRPALS
jgi:hypothetical protein